MISFLSGIIPALLEVINKLGYFGIFIGMTIESSFFPFPSEVILIPAGALISQGKMSLGLVFATAIIGSLLGATINYFIALHLGRRAIEKLVSKYGKVIFLSRNELDKTDRYFQKHGQITTFIGRLLPGIRQLISLPAGFSKMNFTKFALFTSLGAGIWSFILILTGWLADRNQTWLSQHPTATTLIIVAFMGILITGYIWFMKKKSKKAE
jgi:membrane protein DedA with SNARE-associated domain